MLIHVTAASYLVSFCAYAIAIALIVATRTQHRCKALLLAACVISALSAAATAGAALLAAPSVGVYLGISLLEHLRSLAWIAVAGYFIFFAFEGKSRPGLFAVLGGIVAVAVIYSSAVSLLAVSGANLDPLVIRGTFLASVAVAVVALLLLENLLRNSSRETGWSVKYLCFGAGLFFSYDFFVYAQASLVGHVDAAAFAARGLVQAIAVPLILLSAARCRIWPIDVRISHGFVFRSATLLAAGAYLIIMAVVGYSLRFFNSPWGSVSQMVFLMAALVVLAIVLSSGEAQARFSGFITRNFFTSKYDYRAEWLRFIEAISGSADNLGIPERVVRALANIIGSTGGQIWIKNEEDGVFHVAASWNIHNLPDNVAADAPWLANFAAASEVIDLRKRIAPSAAGKSSLPPSLAGQKNAVALIPLVHSRSLVGFVVLGETRAPYELNGEDLQLLKTAARQAASYVAEDKAARALAQVKRFEEFNQRFAFIVHDVKNLAGQLSLILKNAERHGNNPEFQKDMLQTLGDSVGRLRGMLEQLKNPRRVVGHEAIELVDLLEDIAQDWKLQAPNLEFDLPSGPVTIQGQAEPLRAIVCHLIQNALDAAGAEGQVSLEVHIEGVMRPGADSATGDGKYWAVIAIADNGPGMEREFVETQMFQPLSSTKTAGFGIGAFQARQVVRDMGGRLDVESKRGQGTRVTVRLPYTASHSVNTWKVGRETTPQLLRSA
jgi:putative PEP-CTERM system histidine kinase